MTCINPTVYRWGNRKVTTQLTSLQRYNISFSTMAIDYRALGSKDIDITILREVSCEPEMPLKWHTCSHRGKKKRCSVSTTLYKRNLWPYTWGWHYCILKTLTQAEPDINTKRVWWASSVWWAQIGKEARRMPGHKWTWRLDTIPEAASGIGGKDSEK